MKKILVILLTLLLISIDVYAKAGSSASRSSSSFSKSSSSSKSYGTKSNSASATTQYSSTASRPVTSSSSSGSASSASSSKSSTATSTTAGASSGSYQQPQTYNSSGYGGGGYNSNYNQGGTSGGGFFSSMAGGIGGVLIGNALFGNTNHGTSGGGGSSAPASSGGGASGVGAIADNGMPIASSGSIVQPAPSGMSFWAILGTILYIAFEIAIVAGIIYLLWRVYKYIKTRRAMNAQNHEKNLPKFSKLFITIQELIQSSTPDNKIKLAGLCTDEMYTYLVKIKSENGEQNLENIMSNIQVTDTTTLLYEKDDETGALYHSVKIRYKATDYWVDSNTREITEGSRDTILEDIEVWTFVSQNAGSSWKLSAIEQYVR